VTIGTAGPKIAHFDRVEWHVIPDSSTKAAALQNNEVDWWENPDNDLLPVLRGNSGIKVEILDPTGNMACMRLNHLTPPFDNPAIRRALLKGINQQDFVTAAGGDDPKMWHIPTGLFCPGTPMASEVALDVFKGPRDYEGAKRDIMAAGYKGERTARADRLPASQGARRCLCRRDEEGRTQRRLPGVGLG
jgi:peptide/nickel transport system substrate-binding protein